MVLAVAMVNDGWNWEKFRLVGPLSVGLEKDHGSCSKYQHTGGGFSTRKMVGCL